MSTEATYLRPKLLPGGVEAAVPIPGCRCGAARRGPDGGVCGVCGGAIPTPREQVLALPAGPALDELIAERVMGWTRRDGPVFSHESRWQAPGVKGWDWLPEYSTDIAAAWQVVEKLRAGCIHMRLTLSNHEDGRYTCTFDKPMNEIYHAAADAAPLAVCRAALLATLTEARA